jgi:hypothetical protein
MQFLSYGLAGIYFTLPLGESSLSEERVPGRSSPAACASGPPASGSVKERRTGKLFLDSSLGRLSARKVVTPV